MSTIDYEDMSIEQLVADGTPQACSELGDRLAMELRIGDLFAEKAIDAQRVHGRRYLFATFIIVAQWLLFAWREVTHG